MKIKPCPFCGSEDVDLSYPDDGYDGYSYVECLSCDTFGPSTHCNDMAIELWNNRVGNQSEMLTLEAERKQK